MFLHLFCDLRILGTHGCESGHVSSHFFRVARSRQNSDRVVGEEFFDQLVHQFAGVGVDALGATDDDGFLGHLGFRKLTEDEPCDLGWNHQQDYLGSSGIRDIESRFD